MHVIHNFQHFFMASTVYAINIIGRNIVVFLASYGIYSKCHVSYTDSAINPPDLLVRDPPKIFFLYYILDSRYIYSGERAKGLI